MIAMVYTVIDTIASTGEGITCKFGWPRNVVKFVTLRRPVSSVSELMEDSITPSGMHVPGFYLLAPVALWQLHFWAAVNKP